MVRMPFSICGVCFGAFVGSGDGGCTPRTWYAERPGFISKTAKLLERIILPFLFAGIGSHTGTSLSMLRERHHFPLPITFMPPCLPGT
jgi:hypothetical protein